MTPFVDAHHHVWDLDVRDQPWISGAELAPLRRSFALSDLPHGAARTVVVQTVPDAAETPELLALGDPVAGVVGWVDLTAADVADRIAALRGGPGGERLVALRHGVQDEPDPGWLLRPDVQRGLAAVGAAGLVFDLLVTAPQLPAAVAAVRARPDVRFVLDHLGKPAVAAGSVEPWATELRRLAAAGEVSAKLSGLVTEADRASWSVDDLRPYVEEALAAFGPERLMVGSDWPVCTLAGSYDEVLAAARELTRGLSAGEQDAVWGGTATRVYGLPPALEEDPDARSAAAAGPGRPGVRAGQDHGRGPRDSGATGRAARCG